MIDNQRVGGHPSSSSTIPSNVFCNAHMSNLSVFLVVFYEEPLGELFSMSVFTRKLSLYLLSTVFRTFSKMTVLC